MFDRLGVFVGWFTLDDAVAVARDDELAELDVVDAVSALVDKSMCVVDATSSIVRYRYLETMRSYARDHLQRTEALAAVSVKHAAHFATDAVRTAGVLQGPGEAEAAREVERRLPDLRAALAWGAEHGLHDVLEGVAELATLMLLRGSHELSRWFYELREHTAGNAAARGVAYGYDFIANDDLDASRRLAYEMLADGGPDAGDAWINLGWAHCFAGEYDRAIECQQRYYEYREQSLRPADRVFGAWPLAATLVLAGRDPGVLPQQILDRAESIGWPSGRAWGWYAIAMARSSSDHIRGLEAYERGIQAAVDAGNRYLEALMRRDRVENQMVVLPPDQLAHEMIELLRFLQNMGARMDLVNGLHRAAEVLHRNGRLEPAATIVGWLGGRSRRTAKATRVFAQAMAVVQLAMGDAWDPLIERGRHMTEDQVVDLACEELARMV